MLNVAGGDWSFEPETIELLQLRVLLQGAVGVGELSRHEVEISTQLSQPGVQFGQNAVLALYHSISCDGGKMR